MRRPPMLDQGREFNLAQLLLADQLLDRNANKLMETRPSLLPAQSQPPIQPLGKIGDFERERRWGQGASSSCCSFARRSRLALTKGPNR